VTFESIFPAAYPGRWPHIHFEIFPSLASATAGGNKVEVSQLALPEEACKAVFAEPGYEASVNTLAQTTLAKDNVFSDGSSLQMATVTGNVTDGYVATLTVGIAA
jgi:protocatechuate 3,4-dioxygenase beta subunit